MIKGIMFDMGGTLVYNDNFDFSRAFLSIYDHINDKNIVLDDFLNYCNIIKKTIIDVRTTFEIKFIDLLNNILLYFNTNIDIGAEEMEYIFSHALSKTVLVKDINLLLEEYKRKGIKMIVLSNTMFSSKNIAKVLEEVGILKYFSDVIASSDCLVRKPSKYFFEIGLKSINLPKEEVIYIGNDYNYDVLGCQDANLPIVFYNHKKYGKYEIPKNVKEIKAFKELLGVDLCQIF